MTLQLPVLRYAVIGAMLGSLFVLPAGWTDVPRVELAIRASGFPLLQMALPTMLGALLGASMALRCWPVAGMLGMIAGRFLIPSWPWLHLWFPGGANVDEAGALIAGAICVYVACLARG